MSKLFVFQQLLKQIPRRQFQSIVEKHGGDKWVKSFTSWQHLVAMLFAQASAAVRLLDSTVISLSHKLHRWAAFRSNNSGIKVSMVFDPEAQCPTLFEITRGAHDRSDARARCRLSLVLHGCSVLE